MTRAILATFTLLLGLNLYAQELPPMIQEPEIFKMVCEGNLERLKSQLRSSNDLEIQTNSGISLLHKAVACKQAAVIEYLIDKGIDFNQKDNIGRTPLFIALEIRDEKLIDLLKQKNAQVDFNITYDDGLSPLDKAMLFGGLDDVKFMVEQGANINSINGRGATPLAIALRDGFDDVANYLISKGADTELAKIPMPQGEYLGQEKPGLLPKIFAPGIVSIEHGNLNATFHPNGREIYFTVESPRYKGGTIMVTKMDGNSWTTPKKLEVTGEYTSWEPYINPEGTKLFYVSRRPVNQTDSINQTMDIWVLSRQEDSWSAPVHLGDRVNTDLNEIHPSVAANGNLYFSNRGIQISEFKNGIYQEAKPWLDPGDSLSRNADPFIAPDESYLIFASARPGGFGGTDMYISFRNKDGSWKRAINMGKSINSKFNEFPSGLTPDGKYFIFASSRMGPFTPDIYWVSSKVIENLK